MLIRQRGMPYLSGDIFYRGRGLHGTHHRRHFSRPDFHGYGTAPKKRMAHPGRLPAFIHYYDFPLLHQPRGTDLVHIHSGIHKRRRLRHRTLPYCRALWNPRRTGCRIHVRLHVHGHQRAPRRFCSLQRRLYRRNYRLNSSADTGTLCPHGPGTDEEPVQAPENHDCPG